MFRRILVPLDGSDFAERILPLAADLARRMGATLALVLVHRRLPALVAADEAAQVEPLFDKQLREEEDEYLDGLHTRVPALAGLPIEHAVLEGSVASAIAEYVKQHEVDLVTMTTHGRGPISRFWLGSVADRLVRKVHVPILLVRPDNLPQFPLAADRPVLVPLDGSPLAEVALPPALSIAGLGGSTVELLSVVEPGFVPWTPLPAAEPVPMEAESLERRRLRATKYLHELAEKLRAQGRRVTAEVQVGADPAKVILQEVDERKAGLVALATRGLGGAERFLLGSVADKLIRSAHCAVLVVHPEDER